jgi:hypothetical protein
MRSTNDDRWFSYLGQRWVRAATVAHGRQRQSRLELEVRILQVALARLVTKFQLVHLQKLASDRPAVVRFGNIMLDELIKHDAMQFLRPIDPRGWMRYGTTTGAVSMTSI